MKILIDNGHGSNTPGKCSPNKQLREYAWAREIALRLESELNARGYDATRIVPEQSDISLGERVRRVNAECKKYGTKNCVLISIHVNAAGADGKWHDASGFSVFISKNASSNSKSLAKIFTEEADRCNMLGNRSVPKEKYWTWSWTTSDIYILKNSYCPAVLTENYFQDNKLDVNFLLSEKGKKAIVDLHYDAITKYISLYGEK